MGDAEKQFICSVCGYIHSGDAPPESCPICGAKREQFEPYKAEKTKTESTASAWRCLICNYHHEGDQPPENCPVCGAPSEDFEPAPEQSGITATGADIDTIVIVGGGIAGLSAAESARQAAPKAEVILIGREPASPYYRLNLTRYLAGEIERKQLPIHPTDWYEEKSIDLRTEADVVKVHVDEHEVVLDNDKTVKYSKLVLATGAHPFVPPIDGANQPHVATLRTLQDAERLLKSARKGDQCVCIGGGILGIETAGALAAQGMKVTVVETFPWLMPRQLDEAASRHLCAFLSEKGIKVLFDVQARAIEKGVVLSDGRQLDADLVVIAAGVRPNTCLAREAGIEVNKGIIVDSLMKTSAPDIYAAGDVCEHHGVLYGIWEPARYQGMMAGANAGGSKLEFGGVPRANTVKVLGVDMFSVGEFMPSDGSWHIVAGEYKDAYYRFSFQDGVLRGAVMLGDSSLAIDTTELVRSGESIPDVASVDASLEQVVEWIGSHSSSKEDQQ